MNEISTVIEVIKQIAVGLVNAGVNIHNKTWKHIVSWIMPIVVGESFCFADNLSFGHKIE